MIKARSNDVLTKIEKSRNAFFASSINSILAVYPNDVTHNIPASNVCDLSVDGDLLSLVHSSSRMLLLDTRSLSTCCDIDTGIHNLLSISMSTFNSNYLITGSECSNSIATLSLWDRRQLNSPVRCFTESFSNDITAASFLSPFEIAASSMDGTISCLNLNELDENDCIYASYNANDESIFRYKVISDRIYALTHMDNLFAWDKNSMRLLCKINTRETLNVDYCVDIVQCPQGVGLFAGNHDGALFLAYVDDGWNLTITNKFYGHKDSVRHAIFDGESIYSCGDDGLLIQHVNGTVDLAPNAKSASKATPKKRHSPY